MTQKTPLPYLFSTFCIHPKAWSVPAPLPSFPLPSLLREFHLTFTQVSVPSGESWPQVQADLPTVASHHFVGHISPPTGTSQFRIQVIYTEVVGVVSKQPPLASLLFCKDHTVWKSKKTERDLDPAASREPGQPLRPGPGHGFWRSPHQGR